MPALTNNFKELRKRIEPDKDRAATAQEMPAKVRQHLKTHPDFATEDPHTRLAGSYGRRTANGKIKDVDVLTFVDRDWRSKPIAEVMNELHKALKDLPTTLGEGETPELRKQRRSINVYLPVSDIFLDIVPVFKTADSLDHQLEVPDREWDEYVYTHPLGYACQLSDLNEDNGNKVVPVIKMLKHWRDIHFQRNRPKSYWLESIVFRHIARGWVETDDKGDGEIMADLFDSIYEKFESVHETEEETPFVPDGMLRNHVAWNWRRSAFNAFMARLDESRGWARRAVDEQDEAEAVKLWKKVFGAAWFPSTAELEEQYKALGQMSRAGALAVTPTGLVVTQSLSVVKAVCAPAKRFFGE